MHFDDEHLERVCPFSKLDRPLVVGRSLDIAPTGDVPTRYSCQRHNGRHPMRLCCELAINLCNFPSETPERQAQPVHLENLWVPNGCHLLRGSIVVANKTYEKTVACRFTIDNWKTVSEVRAEYTEHVPRASLPVLRGDRDRFVFEIDLTDVKIAALTTMECCIRYSTLSHDYWDNNYGTNFAVSFCHIPSSLHLDSIRVHQGTTEHGIKVDSIKVSAAKW